MYAWSEELFWKKGGFALSISLISVSSAGASPFNPMKAE
jgi:hypothetical protein